MVASESRQRLLNADGTFNVRRRGLSWAVSLNVYHALLTLSWPRFLALIGVTYVATNALFALAFLACGPASLTGPGSGFGRAFFFSVHTLATIGYGNVSPAGLAANLLVTLEAFVGLIGVALVTGIIFARFSRPIARVLFSRIAIVAPYRDGRAFEFRVANARSNQLIELEAQLLFSRMEVRDGRSARRFHELPLERRAVTFFPLAWTIVHPIDAASPLRDETPASLEASDAEFLVLLSAIDETFAQRVHARSSYKPSEMRWDVRFRDIFERHHTGALTVDVSRLDEVEESVPIG